MINHMLAGLLLGSTLVATPALEHRAAVPHRSGEVNAHYRGGIAISQRQVGTVSAPGRASTLRCQWEANLVVERRAHHPLGVAASRSLRREGVATGSRIGWCETSRAAIAQEVAARSDEWHRHMLALAEEDRADLLAEIDRLHAAGRG